jgi:predicted metal-binding membrane protein
LTTAGVGVHARRQRLALTLRWRPEWRVASVVVAAWIALLAGIGMHGTQLGSHHAPLAALVMWTLMVVAMMVPVTLPAVRHVALNSMRRRQQRAIAVYVGAYIGVWMAFGLAAIGVQHVLGAHLGVSHQVLLSAALAAAGGWQLTRAKRRALYACGRTVPLPPYGRPADAACARFALLHAWRCIRSCWAIMLVMVVIGHSSLIWMIALTALVVAEELTVGGRRLTRPAAGVLAAAAAAIALGA